MEKFIAKKTRMFNKGLEGASIENVAVIATHRYEYEEFATSKVIENEHKLTFQSYTGGFVKASVSDAHDKRKKYSFIYKINPEDSNSEELFRQRFLNNFETQGCECFPEKI
jgi:hypothetical protein